MINQTNSQPIITCPSMNMLHQESKNLVISPSLMMMLLEWASKLGDNDIALHQALENMMSFNDGVNPLKIDCFEVIVPETAETSEPCQNNEEVIEISQFPEVNMNNEKCCNNCQCDCVKQAIEQSEDWSDIEGGEVVQAFTDGFNLANQEEPCQDCPCATDEDISCANELGQCCAECGADLSDVPYSDVAPMIIQARDNKDLEGYGASNHEIESFWDGYESSDMDDEIAIKTDNIKGWDLKPIETIVKTPKKEISDDLQSEIDKIINLSAGI